MRTVVEVLINPDARNQEIFLPKGAKILSVQADIKARGSAVTLWAMADNSATFEKRNIAVYQSGSIVEEPEETLRPIGTFQLLDWQHVGHVFEVVETPVLVGSNATDDDEIKLVEEV